MSILKSMSAIALMGLTACGGSVDTIGGTGARAPTLSDVSTEEWAALAQRRIFFGHQSVGGNIVAGIADVMKDNPHIRLNVVESRDLTTTPAPAFHHAMVGRNEYPVEKFDDFLQIASTGFGQDGGVAMLKLCYVDMHDYTNVDSLFADYQRRVQALRAKNPRVTVVHFTTPLTTVENWKGRARALLERRATERDRNVVRHRYNELMRRAYAGKEPLFDIARLESTLPDGRQLAFNAGGTMVPLLVQDYTFDGSHLNERARRMVAEQLLIMLARLPMT